MRLPFRTRWPVTFGAAWLALVPPALAEPPAAPPPPTAAEAAAQPAFGELLPAVPEPAIVPAAFPIFSVPTAVTAQDTLPLDPLPPLPAPPPPGWFGAVTVGAVRPHVTAQVGSSDDPGGPSRFPFAEPGWAVQPRVEVGYRMPDGAGDVRAGYRFLTASGDDSQSPGSHGRVELHTVDLDYVTSEWLAEFTPDWFRDLRASAGVRLATARAESTSPGWNFRSRFVGAGPRVGLEWRRPVPVPTALEVYARAEATGLTGWVDQTVGPVGAVPEQGTGVGIVSAEVGVGWQPLGPAGVRVLAGYQIEQWWNLGRTGFANADLTIQGVFVRGEWRY